MLLNKPFDKKKNKQKNNFPFQYIGCLEIKTSMKLLDFQLRSQVAKECINRVCEAAGLKSSKKRRCDKRIQQALSVEPNMDNAGTNVILRVSSKFLSLVNLENNECIAKHDMPKISFASGGDPVSSSSIPFGLHSSVISEI